MTKYELLQAEMESFEAEGMADGGKVRAYCNGNMEFSSIKIAKKALEEKTSEEIEQLVLAAVRDAVAKTQAHLIKRAAE